MCMEVKYVKLIMHIRKKRGAKFKKTTCIVCPRSLLPVTSAFIISYVGVWSLLHDSVRFLAHSQNIPVNAQHMV